MQLTFSPAHLRGLLASAEAQWPKGLRERYGEQDPAGFWLVGDQGVYLMSNAVLNEGEKAVVVYAEECNPETMPFDQWWEAKRASFGGDDGVEFIEAEIVRRAVADESPVLVEFPTGQMIVSTLVPEHKAPKRKAANGKGGV